MRGYHFLIFLTSQPIGPHLGPFRHFPKKRAIIIWNQRTEAKTCEALLHEFRQKTPPGAGAKIPIVDGTARDVYNISAPFVDEGQTVFAGRVEPRDEEIAEVVFFHKRNRVWIPRPRTRRFVMQDPFVTRIHHQLVFGGVEVETLVANPKTIVGWRTVFYRGASIATLEPFAVGPRGMKDIRLVELHDGRIGVFTRPMDATEPGADIGFFIIERLEDLSEATILNAELFRGQFAENEWGGVGEAHSLSNGVLAVLGHIAYRSSDGHLHYYAYTFATNPITQSTTSPQIIAERKNFPTGPAKRSDLEDVVFSGGLRNRRRGRATLYVGVSDTEACTIDIPDPFLAYETLPVEGPPTVD